MQQPETTPTSPLNDDKGNFWVAGVFYVNADDPRLLVKKPSGGGWTLNYAHRAACWLTAGLFAIIGLLVAFGLFLSHLLR
jgi:uncharacterized membrane protein